MVDQRLQERRGCHGADFLLVPGAFVLEDRLVQRKQRLAHVGEKLRGLLIVHDEKTTPGRQSQGPLSRALQNVVHSQRYTSRMRSASMFAFLCASNDAMLATPLLGFLNTVQCRVNRRPPVPVQSTKRGEISGHARRTHGHLARLLHEPSGFNAMARFSNRAWPGIRNSA